MISLKKFIKSMKNATRGLGEVHAHEHSFRILTVAAVVLVLLIFLLGIKGVEAAILILVTSLVLVLELANSIFERFIDIVSPRVGAQVRDAKDIMAAAVLVASLSAAVISLIIIIPYIKF